MIPLSGQLYQVVDWAFQEACRGNAREFLNGM